MSLPGETRYVLLNEDTGTYETFDTEEELIEFLKEEDFDSGELNGLRVISVDAEYEVTPSYELEEVE